MGVISIKNAKVTTFLNVQGHWGHKKENSLQTLNSFFLGTRNNFYVFNPENYIELSKRLYFFCFNVIMLGGSILFINTHDYFKEVTLFFGLRSLQPVKLNNWVNGSLAKLSYKKRTILFLSNIDNNMYILKEAFSRCIPVIGVQDSNVSVDRISYSIIGNNDSKKMFAEYSNLLSDAVIKAKLFNFCKKQTK